MSNASHPDLELAKRAQDGDDAAWREIYTRTRERLFALLVYHIGNHDEALDVLQDTYVGAVKNMGSYRGDGPLEAWLAGIALRRARDWKRRLLTRFKKTDTLEGELGQCLPQPDLPDPVQGHRLRQALTRIPERQRSAVLLHTWLGYSFREVGEALGCSEATARVHAHRGRETLRELLGTDSERTPATQLQEQRL